jgi:hypothetical protein
MWVGVRFEIENQTVPHMKRITKNTRYSVIAVQSIDKVGKCADTLTIHPIIKPH